MADFIPLVRSYLESAGFRTLVEKANSVVADKLVFGQDRITWIVWTVPPSGDLRHHEPTLRAAISSARSNYPDANAFVLGQSRGGFSREFMQELSDMRVSLTTPIQFFDAPFNVDDAPKAASAIEEIRSFEILKERVAQPYRSDTVSQEHGDGADLFGVLRDRLTKSDAPTVRVIVGRAGIGKSFLFRALFASLYDAFLKAKRRYGFMPRPIPLLPDYLKGLYALRTELLVENFLRTDVASPVGRETFEWLLVNGFASWMLDGLDELYAGDQNFFEYLTDLLTRQNSKAQITIWCRDSLLTTSDAFPDFRDLCGQTTTLEIYHLKEWERSSKRAFAWFHLAGRQPASGESDPAPVRSFLTAIDASATLRALSGLPFYCNLLLTQFQAAGRLEFANDVALLNYTVDEMSRREIAKGLLDLRLLIDGGLEDWLEQIALMYVEDGRYADIDRQEVIEYGELVLRDGVGEEGRDHILTSLLQFPLFRPGTQRKKIAFAHDLIAELLAARGYMHRLTRQPADVGYRLARFELQDSAVFRFMAAGMGPAEEASIATELQHGSIQGRSLVALLSLIMLARPDRDVVRRIGRDFDGQDLAGIRFQKRDLSDLSFRSSDLSNVTFESCDLRRARFEGAFFSRTHFDGNNNLENAQFGDLGRVESLLIGRKLLDNFADIRAWTAQATGQPEQPGEPCPTALQLLRMFSKFITPLGQARRDDLTRRALLAGRRYQSAATPEECLTQAVTSGYMAGPDYRDRFRRADGDKYAEMVSFVRDGSVSASLGRLIASICRRRGCVHQVRL